MRRRAEGRPRLTSMLGKHELSICSGPCPCVYRIVTLSSIEEKGEGYTPPGASEPTLCTSEHWHSVGEAGEYKHEARFVPQEASRTAGETEPRTGTKRLMNQWKQFNRMQSINRGMDNEDVVCACMMECYSAIKSMRVSRSQQHGWT